jgi:hypothetical protein
MTPCAERLCFAAAVLAGTLSLPGLTALEVPPPLLCRATTLGGVGAAALSAVAFTDYRGRAPASGPAADDAADPGAGAGHGDPQHGIAPGVVGRAQISTRRALRVNKRESAQGVTHLT